MLTDMTRGSQIWVGVGSLGILLGSIDPLEGSLLILLGSGFVALGTTIGKADPKITKEWISIFILNVVGVGQLWALSAFGGIGGRSGHSLAWGLLLLPYLVGWLWGLIRIFTAGYALVRARWRAHRVSTK